MSRYDMMLATGRALERHARQITAWRHPMSNPANFGDPILPDRFWSKGLGPGRPCPIEAWNDWVLYRGDAIPEALGYGE